MTAKLFYLTDLPDRRLLEMIIDGDRNAFDSLYHKYWQPLYNAGYKRLRDKDAVEEVIQDLFVHLYQIRASLDPAILPGPYLHAALRNRILNWLRASERRNRHTQLAARRIPLFENNTEEDLSYNSLQNAIAAQLNLMPEKYRAVYKLNKQQYLTVRESAAKLGISESKAEKYLQKAVGLLKSSLGDFQSLILIVFLLVRK